jgi:hypothetical protein
MGVSSSTQADKWTDFSLKILTRKNDTTMWECGKAKKNDHHIPKQVSLRERWLATASALRFAQCIYSNSLNPMHKSSASQIVTSLQTGNPDTAFEAMRGIRESMPDQSWTSLKEGGTIDNGDAVTLVGHFGGYTVLSHKTIVTQTDTKKETTDLYTVAYKDTKEGKEFPKEDIRSVRKSPKVWDCFDSLYQSVPYYGDILHSDDVLKHKTKLQFGEKSTWVMDTATFIVTNKHNTFK